MVGFGVSRVVCGRALNEKRLVQRADLLDTQRLLARPGATSRELSRTVAAIADALAVDALEPR